MSTLRERRAQFAQKLKSEGLNAKAVSLYSRMVADDPTDTETLLELAELYVELEQYPKAMSTFERAGEQHYRDGRATDALAAYTRIRILVRAHAPELGELYQHLTIRIADIFEELELIDDALQLYEQELISRLQSGEGEVHGLLIKAARLHLEDGSRKGALAALAHLRRAFNKDPHDVSTTSLLVRAFDQLGERDKGAAVLKESARIAHESEDLPMYHALVDALRVRSPEDEEVRRLVSLSEPPPPRPPADTITDVDIVIDESVVDEDVLAQRATIPEEGALFDTIETDCDLLGLSDEDDMPTLDKHIDELS